MWATYTLSLFYVDIFWDYVCKIWKVYLVYVMRHFLCCKTTDTGFYIEDDEFVLEVLLEAKLRVLVPQLTTQMIQTMQTKENSQECKNKYFYGIKQARKS